jgi:hypothetical protein
MRPHLHVRHLHRRNRHLLAQSMSPEPSIPFLPCRPFHPCHHLA